MPNWVDILVGGVDSGLDQAARTRDLERRAMLERENLQYKAGLDHKSWLGQQQYLKQQEDNATRNQIQSGIATGIQGLTSLLERGSILRGVNDEGKLNPWQFNPTWKDQNAWTKAYKRDVENWLGPGYDSFTQAANLTDKAQYQLSQIVEGLGSGEVSTTQAARDFGTVLNLLSPALTGVGAGTNPETGEIQYDRKVGSFSGAIGEKDIVLGNRADQFVKFMFDLQNEVGALQNLFNQYGQSGLFPDNTSGVASILDQFTPR